jgi:hypothetical protein
MPDTTCRGTDSVSLVGGAFLYILGNCPTETAQEKQSPVGISRPLSERHVNAMAPSMTTESCLSSDAEAAVGIRETDGFDFLCRRPDFHGPVHHCSIRQLRLGVLRCAKLEPSPHENCLAGIR